jgi:plasmid stability protein
MDSRPCDGWQRRRFAAARREGQRISGSNAHVRQIDDQRSTITMQSLIRIALPMASITLRNLDELTKERLRVRAARQGRSTEDEARDILRAALAQDTEAARNLAQASGKRFEPLGGVELELEIHRLNACGSGMSGVIDNRSPRRTAYGQAILVLAAPESAELRT